MNRRPEGGGGGGEGRNRNRRRRRGGGGGKKEGGQQQDRESQNQAQHRQEAEAKKAPPVMRRYGIVFYDNHNQAREDQIRLAELKGQYDQLNIVIKAEGSMDEPDLINFGKVFAGEAWHLIHRRRVDDGWYNEPHE